MTHNYSSKTIHITDGIQIERYFDASREQVWRALTNSEMIKQWWGPTDFSAPIADLDLRVGGKYFYCMRAPDGKDYYSTGTFREIVPPTKLIFTDSFADANGNIVSADFYGFDPAWPKELLVTIMLDEVEKGVTRLTLIHTGLPAGEERDQSAEGWMQSLDKLETSLQNYIRGMEMEKTTFIVEPCNQEIIVKRIFDARPDDVFRTYTNPSLIPQWWGPARLSTKVEQMDLKKGGVWHFKQYDSSGREYSFNGVYHLIDAPCKIISTFEYDGTPGHVILDIVHFDEENGKTVLTEHSIFQTPEDREGMLSTDMQEGTIETMDRLAKLVENRP